MLYDKKKKVKSGKPGENIFKIYIITFNKEHPKIDNKNINNLIKTCAKDLNNHFHKEKCK